MHFLQCCTVEIHYVMSKNLPNFKHVLQGLIYSIFVEFLMHIFWEYVCDIYKHYHEGLFNICLCVELMYKTLAIAGSNTNSFFLSTRNQCQDQVICDTNETLQQIAIYLRDTGFFSHSFEFVEQSP